MEEPPEPVQITDCAEPCASIRFDTLYTIGRPEEWNLLLPAPNLRAGSGFISTWGWAEQGLIPLFDIETGEFVKTVGRWGGGPGEFAAPRALSGPNGQLWIHDPGNVRISVITPDGTIGREFPFLGALWTLQPVEPDRFLISGIRAEAHSRSFREMPIIHLLDTLGTYLSSFGPVVSGDYQGMATIRMSRSGTVLLKHLNEYRIEEWAMDGRLVSLWTREVDWFTPWHHSNFWTLTAFEELIPDPDGRHVWVMLALTYKSVPTKPETHRMQEEGMGGWEIENRFRFRRIEVIDLEEARVVARSDFDNRMIWSVQHGLLVAEPMYFPTGEAGFRISRMRIDPPTPRTESG